MRDYADQSRATRQQRDGAKESQEQHAADLRDNTKVAKLAAEDLETRKKFRRKRAESLRARQRDRKRTSH
jgi:hypothetical protein